MRRAGRVWPAMPTLPHRRRRSARSAPSPVWEVARLRLASEPGTTAFQRQQQREPQSDRERRFLPARCPERGWPRGAAATRPAAHHGGPSSTTRRLITTNAARRVAPRARRRREPRSCSTRPAPPQHRLQWRRRCENHPREPNRRRRIASRPRVLRCRVDHPTGAVDSSPVAPQIHDGQPGSVPLANAHHRVTPGTLPATCGTGLSTRRGRLAGRNRESVTHFRSAQPRRLGSGCEASHPGPRSVQVAGFSHRPAMRYAVRVSALRWGGIRGRMPPRAVSRTVPPNAASASPGARTAVTR